MAARRYAAANRARAALSPFIEKALRGKRAQQAEPKLAIAKKAARNKRLQKKRAEADPAAREHANVLRNEQLKQKRCEADSAVREHANSARRVKNLSLAQRLHRNRMSRLWRLRQLEAMNEWFSDVELAGLDRAGVPEPVSPEERSKIMQAARDCLSDRTVACSVCNRLCSESLTKQYDADHIHIFK